MSGFFIFERCFSELRFQIVRSEGVFLLVVLFTKLLFEAILDL